MKFNNMITEDYISFEVAKLLKEKGFDENCSRSYVKDKLVVSQGFNNSYYTTMYSDDTYRPISAPTIQMAMKWLREIHNLSIEPYYDFILNWVVDIKYIGRRTDIREFEHIRDNNYNSYEQACEAAIRYTLENLI